MGSLIYVVSSSAPPYLLTINELIRLTNQNLIQSLYIEQKQKCHDEILFEGIAA